MIKVLLADDHPVVRSGYLRLLDQSGGIRVVSEAGDAQAAYAAYAAVHPDVLVTDLTMPGGGLELIRRVRQADADARILVFSMHDSPLLVRRAIDAGALGFVTKASAPDRLVDAVRSVHAGRLYLSSDLAPVPQAGRQGDDVQRLSDLTPREFEIFRRLAQGQTLADCAVALKLSPKTVANHQTIIKDKLGVSTSAALAHVALRHGVIVHPGLGGHS